MISNYTVWKNVKGVQGDWWDTFKRDLHHNGAFCGLCQQRFRPSHGYILCNKCAEGAIIKKTSRNLDYKHYCYVLYDDFKPVYVGVTKNPVSRLQSHVKDKAFDYMVLVKGFSSREKAHQFEDCAIDFYQPTLNKVRLRPKPEIPWQWARDLKKGILVPDDSPV